MKILNVVMAIIFGAMAGCAGQPSASHPAIALFRNSEGRYSTGFRLKWNDKTYFVTSRHAIPSQRSVKGWNGYFDDVHVIDDSGGDALEPSFVEVPMCVLEDEKGYPGFPVTICGFDQNQEYVETKGLVCGRLVGENIDIIFTTAPMVCGMSGSPVLDASGRVIGIAVKILKKKGKDGHAKSAVTPICRALWRMKSDG